MAVQQRTISAPKITVRDDRGNVYQYSNPYKAGSQNYQKSQDWAEVHRVDKGSTSQPISYLPTSGISKYISPKKIVITPKKTPFKKIVAPKRSKRKITGPFFPGPLKDQPYVPTPRRPPWMPNTKEFMTTKKLFLDAPESKYISTTPTRKFIKQEVLSAQGPSVSTERKLVISDIKKDGPNFVPASKQIYVPSPIKPQYLIEREKEEARQRIAGIITKSEAQEFVPTDVRQLTLREDIQDTGVQRIKDIQREEFRKSLIEAPFYGEKVSKEIESILGSEDKKTRDERTKIIEKHVAAVERGQTLSLKEVTLQGSITQSLMSDIKNNENRFSETTLKLLKDMGDDVSIPRGSTPSEALGQITEAITYNIDFNATDIASADLKRTDTSQSQPFTKIPKTEAGKIESKEVKQFIQVKEDEIKSEREILAVQEPFKDFILEDPEMEKDYKVYSEIYAPEYGKLYEKNKEFINEETNTIDFGKNTEARTKFVGDKDFLDRSVEFETGEPVTELRAYGTKRFEKEIEVYGEGSEYEKVREKYYKEKTTNGDTYFVLRGVDELNKLRDDTQTAYEKELKPIKPFDEALVLGGIADIGTRRTLATYGIPETPEEIKKYKSEKAYFDVYTPEIAAQYEKEKSQELFLQPFKDTPLEGIPFLSPMSQVEQFLPDKKKLTLEERIIDERKKIDTNIKMIGGTFKQAAEEAEKNKMKTSVLPFIEQPLNIETPMPFGGTEISFGDYTYTQPETFQFGEEPFIKTLSASSKLAPVFGERVFERKEKGIQRDIEAKGRYDDIFLERQVQVAGQTGRVVGTVAGEVAEIALTAGGGKAAKVGLIALNAMRAAEAKSREEFWTNVALGTVVATGIGGGQAIGTRLYAKSAMSGIPGIVPKLGKAGTAVVKFGLPTTLAAVAYLEGGESIKAAQRGEYEEAKEYDRRLRAMMGGIGLGADTFGEIGRRIVYKKFGIDPVAAKYDSTRAEIYDKLPSAKSVDLEFTVTRGGKKVKKHIKNIIIDDFTFIDPKTGQMLPPSDKYVLDGTIGFKGHVSGTGGFAMTGQQFSILRTDPSGGKIAAFRKGMDLRDFYMSASPTNKIQAIQNAVFKDKKTGELVMFSYSGYITGGGTGFSTSQVSAMDRIRSYFSLEPSAPIDVFARKGTKVIKKLPGETAEEYAQRFAEDQTLAAKMGDITPEYENVLGGFGESKFADPPLVLKGQTAIRQDVDSFVLPYGRTEFLRPGDDYIKGTSKMKDVISGIYDATDELGITQQYMWLPAVKVKTKKSTYADITRNIGEAEADAAREINKARGIELSKRTKAQKKLGGVVDDSLALSEKRINEVLGGYKLPPREEPQGILARIGNVFGKSEVAEDVGGISLAYSRPSAAVKSQKYYGYLAAKTPLVEESAYETSPYKPKDFGYSPRSFEEYTPEYISSSYAFEDYSDITEPRPETRSFISESRAEPREEPPEEPAEERTPPEERPFEEILPEDYLFEEDVSIIPPIPFGGGLFGQGPPRGRGKGKKERQKAPLKQFKSSYFRKFATGESDILTTPENIELFQSQIKERGAFFGYDYVPTREQMRKIELKNLKNDQFETRALGKENKNILNIKV